MIKGSESHYYVEPLYFARLLNLRCKRGTGRYRGRRIIFSTDGRIVQGKAVNGCRFNPVIRKRQI